MPHAEKETADERGRTPIPKVGTVIGVNLRPSAVCLSLLPRLSA
jgi:hypothetical protein